LPPAPEPCYFEDPGAEACVGANFISQGGFFSALNFLLGLQHHYDEEDKPVACQNAVLGHLQFCIEKKFTGKTRSYIELQEVEEDGDKVLRVTYSDNLHRCRREYRRSGPSRTFPEERKEAGGKKRCLDYSHRDRTVNSLSETLPSEKYPLPIKVSSWKSGEPIASLVTKKAYTSIASRSRSQTLSPPTPAYLQLLERREGELWVKYTDHGWFMYLRAINGNLGPEHKVHISKNKAQTSKDYTRPIHYRQSVIRAEFEDAQVMHPEYPIAQQSHGVDPLWEVLGVDRHAQDMCD
jgi:hypothetical protein